LNHPYVLRRLLVEVDEGIVAVVDWLNGLAGVRTLYSCQGDGDSNKPHILFVCESEESLGIILKLVTKWNYSGSKKEDGPLACCVDFVGRIRYELVWASPADLKGFIDWWEKTFQKAA
jgi:hypothetical protein